MKVVINDCFGGFNVSRKCFLELFKRGAKIVKRVSFKDATTCIGKEDGEAWPSDEWTPAEEKDWYQDNRFGGTALFYDSDFGVYAPEGGDVLYCSVEHGDKCRTDPDLIALIENRGSKWASGRCASLKIVEIPDGTDYIIEEYDGNEHIAERHKTWG
jgi:hypothetical protein